LSFHETKNFICGEGGALILNDDRDIDRAHVLYDKGTNRRAFMLGEVDKYSWQDTGSSFGMSDVLAAFLYGQLECRETILAKRRVVFDRYQQMLEPLAETHGIRLPIVPTDRGQAYHMYYVLMPNRELRDHALQAMRDQGVNPTFHYVPLHSAPGGERFRARATECPVTDDISGRLLRLPFHNNLDSADAERVVRALTAALRSRRPLAAH
jgi:dTDP-4-amino-4,6-dideoxygalactose transaminase